MESQAFAESYKVRGIPYLVIISQHRCKFSRRASVEQNMIRLLDQIFHDTGLVGSVCLAGPDPQKGGRLMSLSCVYWFCSLHIFLFVSRFHKPLESGSSFADMYSLYKKNVANPMHSYSALFFHEKFSFLFM